MTPDQIGLVEQSFAMIRPMKGQVSGLFHERLFAIAPETRPLFQATNMTSQGLKLMATLNLIVSSLRAPEIWRAVVGELAERHLAYGVRPEHYAEVGAALIWTFEQVLGPAFDEESKQAWQAVYGSLAETMIASAHGSDATAAE